MIISDLYKKISLGEFLEVCKLKLNKTFVKLNGIWHYCIVDAGNITSSWKMGQEGAASLLSLYRLNKPNQTLSDVSLLDTEPEWPRAGYYMIKGQVVELSYISGKVYKAGLPPSLLSVTREGTPVEEPILLTEILNEVETAKYPTKEEALDLLLYTDMVHVPLSRDILLGAWPFTELPVLYRKGYAVGYMLPDYELVATGDLPANIEIIKHLESGYK